MSRRRQIGGFTLVELLTAMAVVALLVSILGQMLSTMSRSWLDGQRRVNNFTKARAMLDLVTRDLQMGVYRDDLASFPGSDVAFYVMRPGIPTGSTGNVRNVSLVRYAVDKSTTSSVLQRQDLAIDWADPATVISFGDNATLPRLASTTARDTTPGVVGFKVFFINADGTLTTSYNSSVRAASVTLAVIDDKTLLQMNANQISSLRTALETKANGSRNAMAIWNDYLNSGINWSDYPKSLSVGLKIFERYVSFPNY